MAGENGTLSGLAEAIRSGGDADSVRRNVLAALCGGFGARSAFLVSPDLALDKACSSGKPVDLNLYEPTLQKFNASTETLLVQEKICLVKLKFGEQPLGTIGLIFEDTVSPSLPFLASAAAIISLMEQYFRILRLLESSQAGLRSLSGEGALIVKNNARLFEQLTSNVERLQSMSKGVIRMQEEERAKVSRELHDGVGQSLTALKMNLEIVYNRLEGNLSNESRRSMKEARQMAEQSLAEVRELSRLLRPRMLDDLGLFPTLRWYVRSFSKRTGIKVLLETTKPVKNLDPDVQTMLFRITQEALNNIAKHSHSETARVHLSCGNKNIRLKIQDRGSGFDVAELKDRAGSTSGLSGIQDRVNLWGGKFAVLSQPTVGTTLNIEIPMKHSLAERRKRNE